MCQDHVFHCYECQREFNPEHVSCFGARNGQACVNEGRVVKNYETCGSCTDARKAEEACQQYVYRLKPMYYNIERKRAIYEAFCSRQEMLKRDNKKAIEKAEEEFREGKKAAIRKELDPIMVPLPPFITMRHEPTHFLDEGREASITVPLRQLVKQQRAAIEVQLSEKP
ncbi:hypothetical protein GGR53DRAFT_530158 [Hypoxylon sp. FL1150]|nr:hypothetical protein GGR53DRAFT_530158 [Hypoxylon sp. FL1150]